MDYAKLKKDDLVEVLSYVTAKNETLKKGCRTSKKVFNKFLNTSRVTEDDVINGADLQVATISYLMGELSTSPVETVTAMETVHNGRKIKDTFFDNILYNMQTQESFYFTNMLKKAIKEAAVTM